MVDKIRAKLTPTNILISMTGLCIVMVGISIDSGWAATERAQTAIDTANGVKSELDVHVADQESQFESIVSQLGTLRTYNSTLRGDIRDSETKLREDMKGLRELVLVLMERRANPDYSSGLPDNKLPNVATSTN